MKCTDGNGREQENDEGESERVREGVSLCDESILSVWTNRLLIWRGALT